MYRAVKYYPDILPAIKRGGSLSGMCGVARAVKKMTGSIKQSFRDDPKHNETVFVVPPSGGRAC
jgi:hypothetical protein